ncbi:hypothetical protein [Herbaspirillum rubrisubalbicans]|uniref:hypothetical protein n=1 Tax=Herbaspirillum rubrisubalbicans TaxID=80842 RepID=UPI0013DDA88E|nr:hypothetical protein [Herbaspirillum rubrisubalbicans]
MGNPSVPAAVITHLKSEDGMGPGINVIVNTLTNIEANGGQGDPPAFPNVSYRSFYNKWPYWDTENNLSFVFYLNIRGFTFLFTGDIEHDGLRNLLRLQDFAALMPSLDVLVAPHHGRANGVCEELFDDFGANPQLIEPPRLSRRLFGLSYADTAVLLANRL